MREIKFRGKRQYDGEWVYGGIEKEGDSYDIITEESAVCAEEGGEIVIQETIGQYTGLKDKNGVEIYEGDIVKASRGYLGEVDFESFICAKQQKAISEDIEVIGNIYDNPELLEEDNA